MQPASSSWDKHAEQPARTSYDTTSREDRQARTSTAGNTIEEAQTPGTKSKEEEKQSPGQVAYGEFADKVADELQRGSNVKVDAATASAGAKAPEKEKTDGSVKKSKRFPAPQPANLWKNQWGETQWQIDFDKKHSTILNSSFSVKTIQFHFDFIFFHHSSLWSFIC